jgi:tRNA(fMet)-specific endonuclease VapC
LASRERRRDPLDKLIAAHALALDVTLVTINPRDFVSYAGLRIENWVD